MGYRDLDYAMTMIVIGSKEHYRSHIIPTSAIFGSQTLSTYIRCTYWLYERRAIFDARREFFLSYQHLTAFHDHHPPVEATLGTNPLDEIHVSIVDYVNSFLGE